MSTKMYLSFARIWIQWKQHKVHNKELVTNWAIEAKIRLHGNLFIDRNTLQSFGGYCYGRVVIDNATHMQFPITLKSKDTICKELVKIFNQIKTHMRQDLKYFRNDNVGEYWGLQFTFEKKDMLWEKSTPYIQDQDSVSANSIRTILARVKTMLIYARFFSGL